MSVLAKATKKATGVVFYQLGNTQEEALTELWNLLWLKIDPYANLDQDYILEVLPVVFGRVQ